MRKALISLALSMICSIPAQHAFAEPTTEERFQDLFITAGYATAFGAALGTALLAFTDDPAGNLQYVAVGASLGFIGGSIMGTYVIFSPMVVDQTTPQTMRYAHHQAEHKESTLLISPMWHRDEQRVAGIQAGLSILKF